jgi:uncharacterized protein (TIGR04222 family)
MKQIRRIIVCTVAILATLTLAILPTAAETKSLQWKRLDSDITVLPNGDLQVVETNVIDFTSGSFSYGYRDVDTSRLTGVSNIQVTENGEQLRVATSEPDTNVFRITYYFSSARNEERTFKIAYTVHGATRYYSGGDQVYWVAIYSDRNGYPVLNSRVTVTLPQGATATQAATYGASATVSGSGESIVTAVSQGSIDSGEQLEIRVQFPHGIITGQAPSWQAAYDQQRAYDETTKPMINLTILLVSLLIFIGGPALTIVLWYTRGRDPQVGLIAEYLNEPPANIAPGEAGTLVDERADMQDIIATLVDLGRRGVLTMTETGKTNRSGLVYDRDWTFARGPNFGSSVAPFERRLLDALKLTSREQYDLSDLKNKFYTQIDPIKNALYDQLVQDGYYKRSPEKTRSIYGGLGALLLVLTIVAGVVALGASDLADTVLCIPGALGVTTIVFFIIARAMPARTRQGAETKMRLEAFRRYLQNIEKYVDLKTATDQFDKYLPFAIAFGLDRTWISKFSAVDAPAPTWYVPYYPYYGPARHHMGGNIPTPKGVGDISDAARAPGGLEGMNKSLSSGLTGMNAGLTAMFSSVASTFVSTPAPKSSGGSVGGGGGWSGGGSFGGGGSGGGGGGFG